MRPKIKQNFYFFTKMQNIELRDKAYSVMDYMVKSIYGLE
jgi:hypothetical protein